MLKAALVLAYSYIRFSTGEQRKGDSQRRQMQAAADWCARNNARLDESLTFRDLGKSAFLGEHRKNPDRHALAAFLKLVEDGKIPRGSFLIIESLDRLTREHVRAGLMLLLGLIESGIRIVQLSPSEIIYDESSDEMGLMLAIVELSRGHRESKRKSDLSAPAWRRKKEQAREGKVVTDQLPAWVEDKAGKLVLIPDRAQALRRIFELAGHGYGAVSIVRKLIKDGVPAIGRSGRWNKGYVGRLLRDRRTLGEYQPRRGRGKDRAPDGAVVPSYYPAVVSVEEFYAARAGATERDKLPGRLGAQTINLFAGLVKSARGDGNYCLLSRADGRAPILISTGAEQGQSSAYSFPYLVFEAKVLEKLTEIDPAEIVGRTKHDNETVQLAGALAVVEGRIAELERELLSGDIPSLARVLRTQEACKRDLAAQLAEARAKAIHPLADSWGEAQSLVSVLAAATDPQDCRLRLRSALRRVIEEIHLLVVPQKLIRFAAVQVRFRGDGVRHYGIYHKPAHNGFGGRREGESWVNDFKELAECSKEIDLRKKKDVAQMLKLLEEIGLDGIYQRDHARQARRPRSVE